MTFDGASTYVVVPNYAKASKGIAASAWVNAGQNLASDAAIARNAEGILGQGSDTTVPVGQFELGLDVDDAGTPRVFVTIRVGPNRITATAPSAFPLDTWQHVAFSADGAQLRLYVNGVQVAATDYLGNIQTPDVKYLTLGARLDLDDGTGEVGVDGTAPNLLPGKIDDFALWNRALSSDEVSKVYAAGQAGQPVTSVEITPPVEGDGTYKIGLNFGTDQPASTLAAADVAGVEDVAQANWNNLSGQSGTQNNLVAQVDGTAPETTTATVVWASNNTWASTGGGEENNQFTGADKTLMTGYLDTLDSSTTTVTITNLPAALTADGYDVYVYTLGGVPNKGGGYRILDAASGAVLKDFVRVQAPANPTSYTEAPTADPNSTNNIGSYVVFTGLSASAITVEASTANGLGFGSTAFRAPMNAIQLVAPSSGEPSGPPISIAVNAEGNVVITFEGTLQSADAVTGPYTNVANATSPFTTAPTGTKFYRAVEQ
ncbi:MAG: LamG domain-containing protein [Verrucomicrobiia bacterium]